jgi:ElaA protein
VIEVRGAGELDTRTLYRILRLRSEVFVVEQACAYLDPDGRDIEPATRHLWIDLDPASPTVTAAARLLTEPDGSLVLGRIVTGPADRHRGLGGRLVDRGLELAGARPVALNAQAHLAGWYGRWGFEPTGAEFVEDGIPHVPMALPR